MKASIFCVCLMFLSAVNNAASSGELKAQPAIIEPGLTSSLTLTCKFKPDASTSFMKTLNSLTISYQAAPPAPTVPAPTQKVPGVPGQPPSGSTTKKPLMKPPPIVGRTTTTTTTTAAPTTTLAPTPAVFLAAAYGQNSRKIHSFNGTVSGKIDVTGESFLEVIINKPDDTFVGDYECRLNGMDQYGRPRQNFWRADVARHPPDSQSLIGKINALETQIITMKKQHIRWKKIDDDSSVFLHSAEFNGRKYYLSKNGLGHVDLSQFICIVKGGYLAEINDKAEFEFVQKFVATHLAGRRNYPDVYLGARDEGAQEKWKFLHNPRDQMYTDWGGFPSSGYDCMVLSEHTGFYMNDYRCDGHDRFLCEVPL